MYSVEVQDEKGNRADTGFSVDSEPPSVPKLLSPEDGASASLTGGAMPTFQWSKSTSSSDVTYTLQIDAYPDFSNPVVEKTGLTGTRYTLSKSEELDRGEYYWRVKATDSASNESDWSEAYSLSSGSMPIAVLVVIIVFGVIALGVGGYFLYKYFIKGRRKPSAYASESFPEIVVPEVVNAEYRALDTDEATKKRGGLPWRLALPQAPPPAKGAKNLSSEDQARLRVIVDFAKSLPLAEAGNDTHWLVEMAESTTGDMPSPALYSQLLKGDLQLRYEPAWMRHPTFQDLQSLLEGQPILQDLNSYIDSVNHAITESVTLRGYLPGYGNRGQLGYPGKRRLGLYFFRIHGLYQLVPR
jgi:hypothetical protein